MTTPRHIAIIMDGNGRWATRRLLPRVAGHQQGTESVRAIVAACVKKKIEVLTLFTFSSENWLRPKAEVNFLLALFLKAFQKNEIQELINNNVRLNVIGDRAPFSAELRNVMNEAERLTEHNTGLCVNIALNYGGQWDIVRAARLLSEKVAGGELTSSDITEEVFQKAMSLGEFIPPDFLIRTSGEQRISNFLLWDIAYTELYFTETLWPDFREKEFELALHAFATRQRRFGHTVDHTVDHVDHVDHADCVDHTGDKVDEHENRNTNDANTSNANTQLKHPQLEEHCANA